MAARERNYNVVLGSAHSLADEAIELHAVLETRHCDAIILFGDMRDQPRLLEDLAAATVPVVALWQGNALPGIDTVNVDNRARNRLGHRPPRRTSAIGASGSSAAERTATSASDGRRSSNDSPSWACRPTRPTSCRRQRPGSARRGVRQARPLRRPADRRRHGYRSARPRRPPCCSRPRHRRSRAGLDRRLRRHPVRDVRRTATHDRAQPGHRDGEHSPSISSSTVRRPGTQQGLPDDAHRPPDDRPRPVLTPAGCFHDRIVMKRPWLLQASGATRAIAAAAL